MLSLSKNVGLPVLTALDAKSWLKLLAYTAVYIGWGTTYLAIRVGVIETGPATFLSLRFLISAAVLLMYLPLSNLLTEFRSRAALHSSYKGILFLIGGLLPIAYAEKTVPSNITAIIIGCAPVGFALFDRLLNDVPVRPITWLGLILGVGGLVILGGANSAESGGVDALGLVLVILGVVIWCFASVYTKRLAGLKNSFADVFYQYVAAGSVLLIAAILFEGFEMKTIQEFSGDLWISLLYLALVPSIISYTAFMWLLKTEPSRRVSTYAFVNPVVAVIAGAVVLNEQVTSSLILALVLVLAGTFCNFKDKRR